MTHRDEGYAMAALLVAMSVMAVMLSAAMPVWKTTATREKEAELIFRGQEYVRAIERFQRKTGGIPPSIDILVEQKYLRKKYKDPMTGEDFQPVSGGQIAAGGIQAPPGQQGRAGGAAPQGQQQPAGRAGGGFQLGAQGGGFQQQGAPIGGIMGVVSKSTETSFRLYNNRNRYNEWLFVFTQSAQAPGTQRPGEGAGPGLPNPGGRGRGGVDGRGGPAGRGGQTPAGANPFGGQSPFGGGRQAAPPGGGQQPRPAQQRVF